MHILTLLKTLIIMILRFNVGDQNLLKNILQIGLKKVLWLKKLKILFCGHTLLTIPMVKKLSEHFMKNKYKKQNQQGFRTEKY